MQFNRSLINYAPSIPTKIEENCSQATVDGWKRITFNTEAKYVLLKESEKMHTTRPPQRSFQIKLDIGTGACIYLVIFDLMCGPNCS